MEPLERLLRLLPSVKKSGKGYSAKCPGHDDQNASLSISTGEDGCVLLKCHAGCEAKQIVSAVGLSLADLFPKSSKKKGGGGNKASRKPFEHSNSSGLTLAEYSLSKRISVDFLRSIVASDVKYLGSNAVRFEYKDAKGDLLAVRFRLGMTGDRFRWRRSDKVQPYGLWLLERAKAKGFITLCEGDSDTQTLWFHEEPALGFPGADTWQETWAEYLTDIPTIYTYFEPDQGGEAVKKWLSKSKIQERVQLLNLGEYKDPSALYLANPEHFPERWRAILAAAVPFVDVQQAERNQAAEEAYVLAKELLDDPKLLDRIGKTMQARGYAGDLKPPKLAYVGMTSRLLERLQNQAFVSASGAGKNRTVDAAAELMPAEALYLEKAGSARALIYTDEDFQHRVIIVAEADSIPEDGAAASAIRSLAADNYMAYDVVEKNSKTNKWETCHIVKPGPTGLMTTSTRSLGPQMSTRMLEISLPDDKEQTRAVMKAHARSVQPGQDKQEDLTPYLALQRWLTLAGVHQVAVPFADILATLVPPHAVRMRRDFRQLLTCIQAVALLHQRQRSKSREGWIVATIDDYAQARTLLAPIFDTILSEGVTPAIRQTVAAVAPTEEVTEAELAQRLNLSKSTVHYRVHRALAGGWLVNNEKRERHPAKLARGVPLPEESSALPSPETVKKEFECSNHQNGFEQGFEPFEHPKTAENPETSGDPFECSNQNGEGIYPPSPPDSYEKTWEQASCRFCEKPGCVLTPGGWTCRLSEEDRQRWSQKAGAEEAEAARMAEGERRGMREEADNGPQPEQATCWSCGKRGCALTPWGWHCKLSEEDKKRWAARQGEWEADL